MPDVPVKLACTSAVEKRELVAKGTGYGASKAAALSAARADADAQLAIGVTCATGCHLVLTDSDPIYDSAPPSYDAWGAGWKSGATRTRNVQAGCKAGEPE